MFPKGNEFESIPDDFFKSDNFTNCFKMTIWGLFEFREN